MKKFSYLELLLGTAICLILFVFTKGVMGNFNENTQTIEIVNNETDSVKPVSNWDAAKHQVKPKTLTKNNTDALDGPTCDDFCIIEISKSLTTGGLLTANMIASIRNNPAGFAEALLSKPETLSLLLRTIKADEDDENGTQNAAYAVFEALSDEDKSILGQTLISYANDEDRIVGLELLEASLSNQAGSIQTLNKILENERNPRILSKAINVASNLPKETELQDTLQALTNIIRYSSNEQFSGLALVAKVNLAPRPRDVYVDISTSLTSFSEEQNASGLTALQIALQRYGPEFEKEGDWDSDISLHESVIVIAQNDDVSVGTRSQAYELLNSYFGDDD